MGERTLAFDGEAGHGLVVAGELEAPDGAVEADEEHVGHASSVAAASDIDSRESDIARGGRIGVAGEDESGPNVRGAASDRPGRDPRSGTPSLVG